MKKTLPFLFTLCSLFTKAQKLESIHVNLYTDSLKKGTYNYINIDGKLADGKFLPLDSTHLRFWSSAGTFSGNSLWIDKNISADKVDIKVSSRNNPTLYKAFSIYIKQQPDPELKPIEEIMNRPAKKNRKQR